MIRIIPFLIFCLSTICSAELRTWTAVNGNKVEANYISSSKGIVKLRLKSGKLFEVPKNKLSKDDNEFIDSLFKKEVAVGSGVKKNLSRVVDGDKVEEREGVIYLKDSKIPYTGKLYGFHPNGQKMHESNYKNGRIDGLAERWYENGQKESEANFKDGKLSGLKTAWYENGTVKYEFRYKDGKKHGTFVVYTRPPYRQKESDTIYKNGRIVSETLRSWHKNGQKKSELNWNGLDKITEKYWNSKGEEVDSLKEAKAE